MKNIKLGLIIAAGILLVAACATPVLNIANAPLQTGSGQKISLDQAGKAITAAGATLGWQMETVSLGNIVGTLKLRSHVAVVNISYDTQSYSINYKDSVHLNYDGSRIHPNYNGWIQNLDKGIRAQLGTL
ncbi:MAG TPA: hypothetical protein VHE58_04765 [Burkholderiales bacterium]|nr:hypothetical protein [Burkholderiales bacterium]